MTSIVISVVAICFTVTSVACAFSDHVLVAFILYLTGLGCFHLYFPNPHSPNECSYVNKMSLFTSNISQPIEQTAVFALFWKALTRRSVWSFVGIFSAITSLSPLILPIVSIKLKDAFGRNSVLGSSSVLLLALRSCLCSQIIALLRHKFLRQVFSPSLKETPNTKTPLGQKLMHPVIGQG